MQDVLGDATPADLAAAWRLAYAICGDAAAADAAAEAAVAAQVSWLGPPSPVELLNATFREVEPLVPPTTLRDGGDAFLHAWWTLPVDQRAALWLRVADGRSSEIAAAMLALAPGAVVSLAESAESRLIAGPATDACPDAGKLAGHDAGALAGKEASATRRHLASCPRCPDRLTAVHRLRHLGDPETGPVPAATDAGRQALDLCLQAKPEAWAGDLIDEKSMARPEPLASVAPESAAVDSLAAAESWVGGATAEEEAAAGTTAAPTAGRRLRSAPRSASARALRTARTRPPSAPAPVTPARPAPKGAVAAAALAAFHQAMGEDPPVVDQAEPEPTVAAAPAQQRAVDDVSAAPDVESAPAADVGEPVIPIDRGTGELPSDDGPPTTRAKARVGIAGAYGVLTRRWHRGEWQLGGQDSDRPALDVDEADDPDLLGASEIASSPIDVAEPADEDQPADDVDEVAATRDEDAGDQPSADHGIGIGEEELWSPDDNAWAAFQFKDTPPRGMPPLSADDIAASDGGPDHEDDLLPAGGAAVASTAAVSTTDASTEKTDRRPSHRRSGPPSMLTPKVLAGVTAGVLAVGIVGAIIVHPTGLPRRQTVKVGAPGTPLFPRQAPPSVPTSTTPNSTPLLVINPGPPVSTTVPPSTTSSSSTSTTAPNRAATPGQAASGGLSVTAPPPQRSTPGINSSPPATPPRSTTTTSPPPSTTTTTPSTARSMPNSCVFAVLCP